MWYRVHGIYYIVYQDEDFWNPPCLGPRNQNVRKLVIMCSLRALNLETHEIHAFLSACRVQPLRLALFAGGLS